MRPIRTDLAMEAALEAGDLPGVRVNHWENAGVNVTEVQITDQESASRMGKRAGRYITLESEALRTRDPDARAAMALLLGEEIARLLPERQGRDVLVAGLGNRAVTPDSLGPRCADNILVTRHIFSQLGDVADERMRSVCALAPGVTGVTGVETAELLESVTRKVDPACVICVDALAARASSRIGTAIQLTDTGIQPGSGVGNRRSALNRESLGAPVIAVGMPTVIYAATLARDAFALLDKEADEQSLADLERSLMGAEEGELIVTPREIDEVIRDSAAMIAMGVNRALQPDLSEGEILAMME